MTDIQTDRRSSHWDH